MATTREELLRKLREGPKEEKTGIEDLDTDSISFGRISPKKKESDKRSGEDMLSDLRSGFGEESGTEKALSVGAMVLKGVNNITLPPARYLGSLTGDIRLGPGGPEVMSPEEAEREQSPGGSLTIEGEPEGVLERGAEFAGETIALTGPFARALSYVPPTVRTSLLGKAQNFVRSMGTSALSRPSATLGVEGVAGFGAGAGGEIAVEALGDTPAARFTGEILGGVMAPLPAVRATIAGRRYIKRKMEPFTHEGGNRRGRQRFERAVEAESSGTGIRGLDEPTTMDPETGEPVLSAAQRTGERGPMALEKSVMESTDQLAHTGDEQLAHANKVLQEDLGQLSEGGTPEDAQEYLMFLFDTRLRAAAHNVKKKISSMKVQSDRKAANRIFDEELRRVTKVINDQIDELFQGLPKEAAVPTTEAAKKFQAWSDELDVTGAVNIPSQARKFLSPMIERKGKQVKNPQYLGEVTTFNKLRNLQSTLRDHARKVRKDSPKSAAVADDIADAINDDLAKMQAVPEVRERLDLAVNFARDANTVLGKFKLGQMGGRSFTIRNRPTSPDLSAERSIGLGGQEGKQAYDQVIDAIKQTRLPFATTSGVSPGESADVMKDAVRQYFRSRFLTDTVEGNEVNAASAREFIKRHRPVLDSLPDLRKELQTAMSGQKGLDAIRRKTGEQGSAKVAKAAMLIQRDPVKVFKRLIETNPREVGKEVQSMLNAVNKDEFGFAQRGLKASWVDFLFTAGETGGRDIQGKRLLSGAAIKDILDSPQGKEITRRLFQTNKERQRIRTVVNDLVKLEKRRTTAASKEGVLGDKPNTVLEKFLGFVGAGLGRMAGRAAGTGGTVQQPGYGASLMRELGEHQVRDPALRFIYEGIADEGLWRNVLTKKLNAQGEVPRESRRRLNAWAANVLYEMGVQERADPEQRPQEEPSPSAPPEPRFAPGY